MPPERAQQFRQNLRAPARCAANHFSDLPAARSDACLRFPARAYLYRSQSNVPVRRGALRWRSCVRPVPGWHRYSCRRAEWIKSRSLLLKEPERGRTLSSCHALPPGGNLVDLISLPPLDAQFVESLFTLSRERSLYLVAQRFQVVHFEVGQVTHHCHLALDLRRFAQQLRHQQPALRVHLHLLAVIIGPLQEILLGRIEIREP